MGALAIGIVGYDRVQALDIVGALDTFQLANDSLPHGGRAYKTLILTAGGRNFVSESGMTMHADVSFERAPALDTIIVPGGAGLRLAREVVNPVAAFLRTRNSRTRRLVSICTGIYAFGVAGLLKGKRAATHWQFATDVRHRFPDVKLDCDALYVRDGSYYSSAGITAGIDLTLALVEEDLGERVALAVARQLVVYLRREGGQAQFSEPLQFQMRALDRFRDLAHWMVRHLDADLSVDALAARAGVGVRHFSRRFRQTFGVPPASYVEMLRLDEARRRLLGHARSIESVAGSVGFSSADVFRRAFERRFGIGPKAFRQHFRSR